MFPFDDVIIKYVFGNVVCDKLAILQAVSEDDLNHNVSSGQPDQTLEHIETWTK